MVLFFDVSGLAKRYFEELGIRTLNPEDLPAADVPAFLAAR